MSFLKKTSVLFAAVDIGWRISMYSDIIRKQFGKSAKIDSFVKYKVSKKQYETNYTFQYQFENYPTVIQWTFSLLFFCYALLNYKIFYFFSGETILTRKLIRFEFFIYKILGKKVIMHFVGSDIRDPNYLYWKTKNIVHFLNGEKGPEISSAWQKKLIQTSKNYANHILVSTPDLKQIIPNSIYYPVMLDVDSFLAELKSISITNRLFTTKKVKILHAPSNANLKGTVLIDEELEKLLQKNSDIEYLNTANLNRDTKSSYTVSRYELFQLYQEADIVIDQVVIGWYGLQTVEALLSKSQVICYIDEDLKPLLFDECPIIQSSIEELQIKISETVTSIINKEIDFNKNIDWVKKHHGIKNNSSQLIDILK